MPVYRTHKDDMLDAICHKHYGHTNGTVEAVLEANPGLADLGATLPAGILITLPLLPQADTPKPSVRLWD